MSSPGSSSTCGAVKRLDNASTLHAPSLLGSRRSMTQRDRGRRSTLRTSARADEADEADETTSRRIIINIRTLAIPTLVTTDTRHPPLPTRTPPTPTHHRPSTLPLPSTHQIRIRILIPTLPCTTRNRLPPLSPWPIIRLLNASAPRRPPTVLHHPFQHSTRRTTAGLRRNRRGSTRCTFKGSGGIRGAIPCPSCRRGAFIFAFSFFRPILVRRYPFSSALLTRSFLFSPPSTPFTPFSPSNPSTVPNSSSSAGYVVVVLQLCCLFSIASQHSLFIALASHTASPPLTFFLIFGGRGTRCPFRPPQRSTKQRWSIETSLSCPLVLYSTETNFPAALVDVEYTRRLVSFVSHRRFSHLRRLVNSQPRISPTSTE